MRARDIKLDSKIPNIYGPKVLPRVNLGPGEQSPQNPSLLVA